MDPVTDPILERSVVGPEDAPAEDHLDVAPGKLQASDRGDRKGNGLIGHAIENLTCDPVPTPRCVKN